MTGLVPVIHVASVPYRWAEATASPAYLRRSRDGCKFPPVMPAKAGIHIFKPQVSRRVKTWIPAFAGMTTGESGVTAKRLLGVNSAQRSA